MSNTKKRVISAVILVILLSLAFYFGAVACLALIFLIGVLTVDEIFCNFFRHKQFSFNYFLAQGIFVIPFVFVNGLTPLVKTQEYILYAALMTNMFLVFYLFCMDMESPFFSKIGKNSPYLCGLFILLPLISMATIFTYSRWQVLLGSLLLANFGMDTGAWFFGKKFGKHKMWPEISPKKTFEGLIGGMLTAGLVGGAFWAYFLGQKTPQLFLLFLFLGLISQIGDLIQSKIKRQFKLKDSSSLIPGHGGVYDRIDGLIFVSPFYATALRYFHF